MEELRRQLLDRAFLYDHPASYTAGVEETLQALDEAAPLGLPLREGTGPAGRPRLNLVREQSVP